MRVLITGITGMAGSHLADYCLTLPGVEVFGIKRWRSRVENIEHLEGKIEVLEGDLNDASSMRLVIREVKPDRIFHLAAQSFVPTSWRAPVETLAINVLGQVNLFEAIRSEGVDPRVHIAGSSEEYGHVEPDQVPIKETNVLRPLSPYAVSKVAQEMLAIQYHYSYGLKSVVTRAFNHEGPRRGEVFVTSSFAKQVAEIELGRRRPTIKVGDLTSVKEMLDILLSFTREKIVVERDPARLRPSDVKLLVGDATKFRQLTGWEPTIALEQTLEDTLNYWRARLRSTTVPASR
jgi:GDP-4-dehydro-6-deoxy-D-mannose reductase